MIVEFGSDEVLYLHLGFVVDNIPKNNIENSWKLRRRILEFSASMISENSIVQGGVKAVKNMSGYCFYLLLIVIFFNYLVIFLF